MAAAARSARAALDALDVETLLAPGFDHARATGAVLHGAFVGWTWALYARALLAAGAAEAATALADRIDAMPSEPGRAGDALCRFQWREAARIRAAAAEIARAVTVDVPHLGGIA